MNTHQQLAEKVKAITVFLIEHGGKCFGDMEAPKLFRYVAFHLLHGSLFSDFDASGKVGLVIFLWPENRAEVWRREAANEPHFAWQPLPTQGDSFFVGGLAGKRKFAAKVLKMVSGAWPESPRKKFLTYRRGRLTEFDWSTFTRFSHGQIA